MGPVAPPEAAMTRRRLLLAMGTALAVLVAVSLWLALREPGGPGITEANCARIKPGMRLGEVKAILGPSPVISGWVQAVEGDTRPKPCAVAWLGEEGTVSVVLDEGTVSVDLNDDETVASVRF